MSSLDSRGKSGLICGFTRNSAPTWAPRPERYVEPKGPAPSVLPRTSYYRQRISLQVEDEYAQLGRDSQRGMALKRAATHARVPKSRNLSIVIEENKRVGVPVKRADPILAHTPGCCCKTCGLGPSSLLHRWRASRILVTLLYFILPFAACGGRLTFPYVGFTVCVCRTPGD